MNPITCFRGYHRFLSNFYGYSIEFEGARYSTVEHAYQAAKTSVLAEREEIRNAATPETAKRLGKRATLRKDWNEVKLHIMQQLLSKKFEPGSILAMRLLSTAGADIIEVNNWGDTFWGTYNGEGSNHLGQILMSIRSGLEKGVKV